MKSASFVAIIGCAVVLAANLRNATTGPRSSESRDEVAEKRLMALEHEAYQETLAGNTSHVLAAVSSDFVGWDSGMWDAKLQWVPWDKDAFAKDLDSSKETLNSITIDELMARVHGTTGIVRVRAVFKRKDGRDFEMHFLDTWEKSDNDWIMVGSATFSQENR